MSNSTTAKGLARLLQSSLRPYLSPYTLSLQRLNVNSKRFNLDKYLQSFNSTDTNTLIVLTITLTLLILTCLYYSGTNILFRKWHWRTKPKSKEFGAGAGAGRTETGSRQVSNSNSEGEGGGRIEADPFRECDFSNVKVSKILIHPIKVRSGLRFFPSSFS